MEQSLPRNTAPGMGSRNTTGRRNEDVNGKDQYRMEAPQDFARVPETIELSPMHIKPPPPKTERRRTLIADEEAVDKTSCLYSVLGTQHGLELHGPHKSVIWGDVTRLTTYDPESVRSTVSFLLTSDLTVCYSFTIWAYHFGYVAYAFILMFLLAFTQFPDGKMGDMNPCKSSDGVDINLDICQMDGVMKDAKDDFHFLIGFILAGFVGGVVSMWLTRRSNYAKLCGKTRELNIMISTYIEDEPDGGTSRKTLARWSMLAYELAMLKAQKNMDSNQGRMALEANGLLAPGEWQAMIPGDRHTTVYFWLSKKIHQLYKEGCLGEGCVGFVTQAVIVARGQANDLMSCIDRDNPFPYVALTGLLVKVNLFIMSTWKAVQWSIWMRKFGVNPDDDDVSEYGIFNRPKWWFDFIVLFAWNVSYGGLYDLGYMLYNPFKERRIDIAHESIGGGIRRTSAALASGTQVPPTMALNSPEAQYASDTYF